MNAILVNDAGGLALAACPQPVPLPSEALIRVCSTSVNRADLLQAAGRYPPPTSASKILGLECSGVIVAFGTADDAAETRALRDAHAFRVGDRVCALLTGGGYAEYATVPVSLLMAVPKHMPLDVCGAVPEVWMTALQLVHVEGGVKAGQSVLIHAAGSSVGKAAIQLCRAAGASTIVATAGTAAKLGVAQRLGATVCVSRHGDGWLAAMEAAGVRRGTIDLILDPIGGSYWKDNAEVIAVDGTQVVYGLMGGGALPTTGIAPVLSHLLRKRVTLKGTTLRTRSIPYKERLAVRFERDHILWVLYRVSVLIYNDYYYTRMLKLLWFHSGVDADYRAAEDLGRGVRSRGRSCAAAGASAGRSRCDRGE